MKNTFFKKALCLLTATLLIASSTVLSSCNKSSPSPAATWMVNAFAPSTDTKGNVGDMWLNTSTYDIYQLTNEGWILCGNTKTANGKDGEDGIHGKDGINGKDGTAWLTGEGVPNSFSGGKVGDMYFDTVNFKVYQMNVAGAWEYVTTLGNIGNPDVTRWDDDGELKILMLGNSFSDDTSCYMYHIAKNAMANDAFGKNVNIDGFKIATLHKANCTLDIHLSNAQKDIGAYNFRVVTDDKVVPDSPVSITSVYDSTDSIYKISDAVKSDNWDFISFQEFNSDFSYTALPELIDIVSDYCPTAQIVWHMTWAYEENDTPHTHLAAYGGDQMKMYNALVEGAQNAKKNISKIDLIAPTGTAIQNARATAMGDTFTRDGYHLSGEGDFIGALANRHNGRYIAALTFFGKLSGIDLTKITYRPTNVSETDYTLSIQAAKAAIENPFAVTL